MADNNTGLFRKESLERLSSPEQLDQLLQVVNPRDWLPLGCLAALVGAGLMWSIFGRIPLTVSGQGVLVYPSRLIPMQASSGGSILQINAQVGERLEAGQVLAVIDQAELQKRLEEARNELEKLRTQNQTLTDLENQRLDLELRNLQAQRQNLTLSIAEAQEAIPVLRDKGIAATEEQQRNLEQRLVEAQQQVPVLLERLEQRRRLLEDQVVTGDVVLSAEQEYLAGVARISDIQAQLKQIEASLAEAERNYLSNLRQLDSTRIELQGLDSRENTLRQQTLETRLARQNQIEQQQSTIAQLELQLLTQSQIRVEHTGVVTELTVIPGQVVGTGQRLGTLEVEDEDSPLIAITSFSVGDGKRIQPGMAIQVTPVSVRREEFGGILGQVTQISNLPVSQDEALRLVGNEGLVRALVSDSPTIQVYANLDLDPNTVSGYRWSSSLGPPVEITAGTTTLTRVTIGERAPITFVMPFLRDITGVY
ncbi:MAG: NHLP bacteriocin system secretion protein [Thermostichus sp. DG02_5_bins_236]